MTRRDYIRTTAASNVIDYIREMMLFGESRANYCGEAKKNEETTARVELAPTRSSGVLVVACSSYKVNAK
jgi:hypothetical protein